MDEARFDRLTRAWSAARNRRGLLALLAGVPLISAIPTLLPAGVDADGRRKRRKKRHKHEKGQHKEQRKGKRKGGQKDECAKAGQARKDGKPCCKGLTEDATGQCVAPTPPPDCEPDPVATTCAGLCGTVTDNCGQAVDCSAVCAGCCHRDTCVSVDAQMNRRCGSGGANCTNCLRDDGLCQSGTCVACDVCADGACDFSSIQAAIDANPGQETFHICPGEYPGNLTLTRTVELIGAAGQISTDAVTLTGEGTGSSVVTIPDLGQNVTLRQLVITGGNKPAGAGGGILHEGAALTLTDCTIAFNVAFSGAGLSVPGGSPARSVEMTGCTLKGNSSSEFNSDGGGLFNGASATVRDCDFAQNQSFRGAGINNEGTLTLHTSTVSLFNSAALGGGIHNTGTLTLHETTVGPSNHANDGGGIFNESPGTVTLDDDSVVCGNIGAGDKQCAGFTSPACQNTCP